MPNTITISRAPGLTRAAVVAERLGFKWDEASLRSVYGSRFTSQLKSFAASSFSHSITTC
jgi:hypothetical protein